MKGGKNWKPGDPPMGGRPDDTRSKGPSHHGRGMSTNFGIWWDGDLLRELLDHEMVLKYDWTQDRPTW